MKNKKVLGYIIAVIAALIPAIYIIYNVCNINAEAENVNVEDYNTMNLVDTLAEEEIEFKTDYKESDDQVVIYLFRGKECGYCRSFLTYLSKLDAEKLNKIKVVGFESWYDEANYNLLNEIGKSLGQEASGVPYIIIGDQVFPGYADTYDADIEAKINELYAQKPGNRYDVFEEHNKALAAAARDEIINKYSPVICNYFMVLFAAIGIINYINYSNAQVLKAVKASAKQEKVEEKEVAKKTNKKNK